MNTHNNLPAVIRPSAATYVYEAFFDGKPCKRPGAKYAPLAVTALLICAFCIMIFGLAG